MSGLVIQGATIFDTSFTLDVEGFPPLVWNVTRMEQDAFAGKFGPVKEVAFAETTIGGPGHDPWKHLEQIKVQSIIRSANTFITRGNQTCKLIDLPGIAVILRMGGVGNVLPVDGNHRAKAREIMGLSTFRQFVVPSSMEGQYRITIKEV